MDTHPAAPFLAQSAAIAAQEKQQRTAAALYLAALCAANDAAIAAPAAFAMLENIRRSHYRPGQAIPPDRPDWRAAHDAALTSADNEPDPMRAACLRLMSAHCWHEITRGGPDHPAAGRRWRAALATLETAAH